tara:strand:- start:206 stop:1771 length:1566 start_codon:yes stop_codon:yes gene_type:complete
MSTLNKLIANVQKSSSIVDNTNFLNNEKIVCIDTSNNRIGINTIYPQCSIDISGDDAKLKTKDLEVTGDLKVPSFIANRIDCSSITCSISCDVIDCSQTIRLGPGCNILYNTTNPLILSNTGIECTYIISEELDTSHINVSSISADNINILNTIDCSSLISNDLVCKGDISSSTITCNNITLEQITIRNDGASSSIFTNISCIDLNVETLVSNEISANTIDVSSITSSSSTSYNIFCNNNLEVTNQVLANDITCDILKCNNIEGSFNIIQIDTIDNVNIGNLTVNKILNCRDASYIILPSTSDNSVNLTYNTDLSSIQLNHNNKIFNIYANPIYAQFELKDTSGNEISGNQIINEFSNNLIFNIHSTKYKYIPIKFKDHNSYSLNNGFAIDTSSSSIYYDIISDENIQDKDSLYNININLTLQYLNIKPGDVEITDFKLGIYNGLIDNLNDENLSIEEYVSIQDSIIAFDTSFNYRSCNLNYIGKLYNTLSNENIMFLISSDKELRQLHIKKFSGNIMKIS